MERASGVGPNRSRRGVDIADSADLEATEIPHDDLVTSGDVDVDLSDHNALLTSLVNHAAPYLVRPISQAQL
ncbi:hypothetical protein EBO15_28200 [Actinomadura harenae]|uniref:Uncharacterized protein n=1 Tax=Actinomadura harenae TaxID=2483351 RepID=A0A3M2LRE6_9ACTN|nr:hypothetical protein EBO15_28200 [Actinomadura harenae]